MNNDFLLIIVILFCIFVLALIIRILAGNRRNDITDYNINSLPDAGMQNPDEAIKKLIEQGSIMQAIKLVKETRNIGLKEAKEFVENYEFSEEDDEGIEFELPAGESLSGTELDGKVTELLMKNEKIYAIKLVRESLNIGLKEAKDYVEEIERSLNL